MPTTIRTPMLLGKPIQFVASAGFNEMYGGLEAALYMSTALKCLQAFPCDMLVFEMPDESHYQVQAAGYHLTKNYLAEKKILFSTESLKIKKFWCKTDDYGDRYVATFLFPEEY